MSQRLTHSGETLNQNEETSIDEDRIVGAFKRYASVTHSRFCKRFISNNLPVRFLTERHYLLTLMALR